MTILNPGRTAIAHVENGRLECWSLDAAGRVTDRRHPAGPELEAGWRLAGWAATDRLWLWRRRSGRSELRAVDVAGEHEPRQATGLGRPIACRTGESGRLEVAVAVSLAGAGSAQLYLSTPEPEQYLLLESLGEPDSVAGWDAGQRLLVVNVEAEHGRPGVRVLRYDWTDDGADDGAGHAEVGVDWPSAVRPLHATDLNEGVAGLTGIDGQGRQVPGLLLYLPRTPAVRWFGGQPGYAAADVTADRLLCVAWNGEGYAYRVLDHDGRLLADVPTRTGLATDLRFSQDGSHLVGWHQSPETPPTLVRWNWRDGGMEPLCGEPAGSPSATLTWEQRRIPDAGGQAVPEWVIRPVSGGHGGIVLFLHGGPGGRLNQTYDPVLASLARAGWTVVGMNYPGSTGYGREFQEQSRGDWGGADARAIQRRLDSLAGQGRPVCLLGQSYGAYLALLVAAARPELVEGLAVWAPVTDLPALLDGATGTQRRWLEDELGDLRRDAAELRERSPITRLAELSGLPLLVGHGREDDRCPVDQSRTLVKRLRRQPAASAQLRYLEDADGTHDPSDWGRWADAVLRHFDAARLVGSRR